MSQPADIIWNAITDSAKKRFDYAGFHSAFADFDNANIAEKVLFSIISGYAAGDSAEDIAAEINRQFLLIGCSLAGNDLTSFISHRRTDLFREIEATDTAMSSFEMGLQTPGILVQVRSLLSKP